MDQMELKLPNLFRTQLVGRLAEELAKLIDVEGVRVDRARRIVSQPHVIRHAFDEGVHPVLIRRHGVAPNRFFDQRPYLRSASTKPCVTDSARTSRIKEKPTSQLDRKEFNRRRAQKTKSAEDRHCAKNRYSADNRTTRPDDASSGDNPKKRKQAKQGPRSGLVQRHASPGRRQVTLHFLAAYRRLRVHAFVLPRES